MSSLGQPPHPLGSLYKFELFTVFFSPNYKTPFQHDHARKQLVSQRSYLCEKLFNPLVILSSLCVCKNFLVEIR